jgi:nitrogen fixation protein
MASNNIRTDFWLAAADQDGGTPTITLRFEEAFYLGAILVHNGWSDEDDFTDHQRPKTLELSFPETDIAPIRVELADESAEQSFYIDAKDVDRIVVKVLDTYAAGADDVVGLREIEFKKKQ